MEDAIGEEADDLECGGLIGVVADFELLAEAVELQAVERRVAIEDHRDYGGLAKVVVEVDAKEGPRITPLP